MQLSRTRSALGAVAALAVFFTVTTAANAARAANPSPLPITIGTNSITAGSAQVPIAQALGYFAKVGLTVKYVTPLGSGSDNALVGGQVDLVLDGLSELPLLAAQGKDAIAIRATAEVGRAAFFAGGPGMTLAKLRAKAGHCTIGTLPPGSLTYGYAAFFNNILNLHCDIVPMSTATVIIGALVAGRVDAIGQSHDALTAALSSGQAVALIDPAIAADRRTAALPDIPESAWTGIRSNLASKREAVIRFLKAMDMVDAWEEKATPDQIAAVIARDSNYAALGPDNLKQQWINGSAFVLPNKLLVGGGQLTPNDWNNWLNFEQAWGLPDFDPSASYNTFAQRIDMSYLNAARKAVAPPKNMTHFAKVDKRHNTLKKVAKWKLGSAAKWTRLYKLNTTWFVTHKVSRAKAATHPLPIGLRLGY